MSKKDGDDSSDGGEVFPVRRYSFLDLLFILIAITVISFSWLVAEPWEYAEFDGYLDVIRYLPVSPIYRLGEGLGILMQWLFFPLIGVLAFVIYNRIWNWNFTRLKPSRLPAGETGLLRAVAKISKEMGLKETPEIRLVGQDNTSSPWVLWRGRHVLVVPRSFINAYNNYPEEKEAVLFHELAHIRNGDVWKTLITQSVSVSFIVIGSIYILLQILSALPEWYWLGSVMSFFIKRFAPILLISISLVYLNIAVLRERELEADQTAARFMGRTLPLRRALVRVKPKPKRSGPEPKISFDRFILAVRHRIQKYHPSAALRNQLLFDPHRMLVPRIDLLVLSGFLSVLAVETTLRAAGAPVLGSGWGPFSALLLEYVMGLLTLGPFLIPLYFYDLPKREKIATRSAVAGIILCCFAWGVGATLGGVLSIPVLEPIFFNLQSPWSILISNLVYTPWEIAITFLTAFLILRELRPVWPNDLYPGTHRFTIPSLLVIASVPVLIWLVGLTISFDAMDSLGWRSYEFQIVVGAMLVYFGWLLFALGYTNRKLKLSLPKTEAGIPAAHKEHSFSILPNRLTSSRFVILFAAAWIGIFLGIKELHQAYVYPKWTSWRQAELDPPPVSAPPGFVRFSDARIQVSSVYPQGWRAVSTFNAYIGTLIFSNPASYQEILVSKTPASSGTPEENIRFASYAFSDTLGAGTIRDLAEPVSLPTKAGLAEGYEFAFFPRENLYVRNAVLSLDWNSDNVDYTIVIRCYPEDREACDGYFDEFLANFDYVSPGANVFAQTMPFKVFQDNNSGFSFEYPVEWTVFDLSDSNVAHIDPGAIIQLEGDHPPEWIQITLEEDKAVPSTSSLIIVKRSRLANVDAETRLERWITSNQSGPTFKEFRVLERQSGELADGLKAYQISFALTDHDGKSQTGGLVVISDETNVYDFVGLCDPEYSQPCFQAFGKILATFKTTQLEPVAP